MITKEEIQHVLEYIGDELVRYELIEIPQQDLDIYHIAIIEYDKRFIDLGERLRHAYTADGTREERLIANSLRRWEIKTKLLASDMEAIKLHRINQVFRMFLTYKINPSKLIKTYDI